MGIADAARLLIGNGERNLAFVLAGDDHAEPSYTQGGTTARAMCTASTRCFA